MISATVTACAAFWLMVPEAKTEMVCLETKRGGKVSFAVIAADQLQRNGRGCVSRRGYQRTRRTQCRDKAAPAEGLACSRPYRVDVYGRRGARL